MHADLRQFLRQFAGVVGATLGAVALITFVAMPLSLGGHPGEQGVAFATERRIDNPG